MKADTLRQLNSARTNRKAAIIVTNLSDGNDSIILEGKHGGDKFPDELNQAISKAFRSGKSSAITVGDGEYFLNAHLPPPRIVVIGAVHISQALVPIAKLAGFDIEVIDPRTAFATPERFEDTTLFADWPEDVLKSRPLDPYCALAAVTHDPKIDDYPIRAALEAKCFYIGALGSRKTHAKRVERLLGEGVSQSHLDQIHAPIGLDISAASPQEIAVAVMAEIIHAFRTRGA